MGRAAMIVGVGFDGGGLARAADNTGRYFLRFLIGRSCCSHVQSPFMSSASYGHFGQDWTLVRTPSALGPSICPLVARVLVVVQFGSARAGAAREKARAGQLPSRETREKREREAEGR